MSYLGDLDKMAAQTTKAGGVPAGSQPFLANLDMQANKLIQGQGMPIQSPQTNWLQNLEIGYGHGMERTAQGVGQFADWLKNEIPKSVLIAHPELNAVLSGIGGAANAISSTEPSAVKADEATYQQTPAAKSFAGKTGNFIAQSQPFLFSPEAKLAEGTPWLARVGLGALKDTGLGAGIGAMQPVTQPNQLGPSASPGASTGNQQRLANTLTYGLGGGATSFAGRLLGHAVGALGSKIPWIRDPIARNQVGNFLNEHALDTPQENLAALNRVQNAVPGFTPTLAGLERNPVLGGMERALGQNPDLKLPKDSVQFGGQPVSTALIQQGAQNRNAITRALGNLGDVQAAPSELGQNVGKTLNDIYDAAKAKEDALWNNPDLLDVPVNVSRLRNGMVDWMNSLPVDNAQALPSNLLSRIDAIPQKYGLTAPFREVHALRSNLLRDARSAKTPLGEATTQSNMLNEAAHNLLANLGTGEGFSAAESKAGPLFREAADFTKGLHNTFAPLMPALKAAKYEESRVGPWMINASKPIPERTDAFVNAGQKYLDNADAAPQAARDYLVNAITNSSAVTPKNPNAPVSSEGLGRMLKNNWKTIQKLYPDQARQDLLRNIHAVSEMGDYTQNLKPQDMGSDTANKLLGNMWISQGVGHGVRLGDIWGHGLGWALNENPETRQSILAQAMMDPKKAALLRMKANSTGIKALSKAFGLISHAGSALTASAGAQEMNRMIQPEPNQ